jgi:hypothetical protein
MKTLLRRFLHLLWRILTLPFRVITWPFRKIRDFINYEPEDTPATDVIARTIEEPKVLFEHIDALRKHLFRALVVLIITTAISFVFASDSQSVPLCVCPYLADSRLPFHTYFLRHFHLSTQV